MMWLGLFSRAQFSHRQALTPFSFGGRYFRHTKLKNPRFQILTTTSALFHRQFPTDTSVSVYKPTTSESSESIEPESVRKTQSARANEAPRTDWLLTDQSLSNKEQRKADWAIMKEMSRYLWPKV